MTGAKFPGHLTRSEFISGVSTIDSMTRSGSRVWLSLWAADARWPIREFDAERSSVIPRDCGTDVAFGDHGWGARENYVGDLLAGVSTSSLARPFLWIQPRPCNFSIRRGDTVGFNRVTLDLG